MTLRTYLAMGAVALVAIAGCDEEDHSHGGGGNAELDGGGHEGHDHEGHDHEGHGDNACLHGGAVVACDEEVDAIGSSASGNGVTVTVTDATPETPMAGAGQENMLMLRILDATEQGVTGATLDTVFTEAHGMHESCGAPELEEMEDGMYQLRGVTYPHGGTWHHVLLVDGQEIDVEVCVMNEEGAE